jgi:hypothetical protein
MEIERKVKVGDGRDFIVGVTSGPRTTTQVPAYTRTELEETLADTGIRMRDLFRPWRERQRRETQSPPASNL